VPSPEGEKLYETVEKRRTNLHQAGYEGKGLVGMQLINRSNTEAYSFQNVKER
jgi:hypothetical protein